MTWAPSPAVEYLETDEYIESQRFGRDRHSIDTFGHAAAATDIGHQDTCRRPMFEVLEDHSRSCIWPDCSTAKHLKQRRRYKRRARGLRYTSVIADETRVLRGTSPILAMSRRIIADAYELPETFLNRGSFFSTSTARIEVNGIDISDHVSDVRIN